MNKMNVEHSAIVEIVNNIFLGRVTKMNKKILLLGALTLCLTTVSLAMEQGDELTVENDEPEELYNKLRAFYRTESNESFDFLGEELLKGTLKLAKIGAFDSSLEKMGYFKKADQKEETSFSSNPIDPLYVMKLLKKKPAKTIDSKPNEESKTKTTHKKGRRRNKKKKISAPKKWPSRASAKYGEVQIVREKPDPSKRKKKQK